MTDDHIRPIALGLPRRAGEILVAELYDATADERFYRPIGGAIEFGESSRSAIVREFGEEIGIEVEPTRYLGTIENRFTFEGIRGHEIAIVHEVDLPESRDRSAPFTAHDDGARRFPVRWKRTATLRSNDAPVYPAGLLDLLQSDVHHVPPSGD